MAEQDAFALGRSNLNRFLFADIGIEGSGMPLSVLSALARLGLDPWQEAGRLARLPRLAAADGLAALITAMPASLWSMTDATARATRLVALLPGQGGDPAAEGDVRPVGPWLIAAVAAMTLIAGLAMVARIDPVPPVAARPAAAAPIQPVPTGD